MIRINKVKLVKVRLGCMPNALSFTSLSRRLVSNGKMQKSKGNTTFRISSENMTGFGLAK